LGLLSACNVGPPGEPAQSQHSALAERVAATPAAQQSAAPRLERLPPAGPIPSGVAYPAIPVTLAPLPRPATPAVATATEPAARPGSEATVRAGGDNARADGRGPVVPPGSVRVHLASYGSQGAAMAGWKTIRARYPTVLGDAQPILTSAAAAPEALKIRLLAGPFDRAVAASVCAAIVAQGGWCQEDDSGG
jgi:hypothetical protein